LAAWLIKYNGRNEKMLQLLHDIQAIAGRYREARIAMDAATHRGDKGTQALHWERLLEAEAEWMLLMPKFADAYASRDYSLEEGMEVVWRRGSVGLQGVLTSMSYHPGSPYGLCRVRTEHGEYAEFIRNLMPLEAVS
jgi:hypothetical protein